MSTTLKLSKDKDRVSVYPTFYWCMIGSLLYLIASRPDIFYNVGVCARYQSNPKESHISAGKRIMRYVSGTLDWYLLFGILMILM